MNNVLSLLVDGTSGNATPPVKRPLQSGGTIDVYCFSSVYMVKSAIVYALSAVFVKYIDKFM